jgi:hypothetical protein
MSARRVNTDWFAIDDIKLTFDDDVVITVPGQQEAGNQPHARQKSDEFIGAIRAGLSF